MHLHYAKSHGYLHFSPTGPVSKQFPILKSLGLWGEEVVKRTPCTKDCFFSSIFSDSIVYMEQPPWGSSGADSGWEEGFRTCFRMMAELCVTKRCRVPRTNTCTQDPETLLSGQGIWTEKWYKKLTPNPSSLGTQLLQRGCSSPAWEPNAKSKSKYLMAKSSPELKSVLYLFLHISMVLGCKID